jgi:ribosome recycling factor
MLHKKLEDGRVKVRQVRHEKMGEFKRDFEAGILPEDDRTRLEEELQKLTDKYMAEIEEIGKAKEAELMKI